MQSLSGHPTIMLPSNHFSVQPPPLSFQNLATSTWTESTGSRSYAITYYSPDYLAVQFAQAFPHISPQKIYALAHAAAVLLTKTTVSSVPSAKSSLNPTVKEYVPMKEPKPNMQRPLYKAKLQKTELCKKYLRGSCRFNTECWFAHGQTDLQIRKRSRNYKTISCSWPSGQCPYEIRCIFKHNDETDKK